MFCVKAFSNLFMSIGRINAVKRITQSKQPFLPVTRRFLALTNNEDDSDTIISDICKGDPELEKKLRILMLEVEVMRQDGRLAPDLINSGQWEHLVNLQSKNQRSTYLKYLWKTEKSRENQKAKKIARKKEMESTIFEPYREFSDDLLYGIQHQSLFLRIRDQSINQFDNFRNLQAIKYGQSIVLDCSYENYMISREILNAAKQVTYVFGDNRVHKDPFNLHICNVNLNGEFMTQLRKNIPNFEEPSFPVNIHETSYLDIFPRDKLVYLTPHCREELTNYDPDIIYIIGCMVDKVNNEPLSLAKAKKDGVKMAKLPLDRYLEWAPGSKKNLNINHVIPILLDLKLTGDWEFALRHIPRRKIMETKILAMQNRFAKNRNSSIKINNFLDFKNTSSKKFRDKKKSLYYDNEKM